MPATPLLRVAWLITPFKMGNVDIFKFPDVVVASSAIVVAIEYFKNFHLLKFATDETCDGFIAITRMHPSNAPALRIF